MTLTSTQRTLLVVLVVVCLVSLSAASFAVARWGYVKSLKSDTPRGITVTDSAEVKVQPDTAFIVFGVVNRDRNAQKAARDNAAKTAAVINAILKRKVPKSDIKTIDYSLEPSMDWEKNPPAITGYTASNSVRVRTKDMAAIGDLMDAAVTAGANNVRGISFDVEDKKALRRRALALAVDKAEGKAQAIAEALGSKLGPAISASESVDEYVPETRNAYVATKVARIASTPISPGETSVSAQVKVVYSVR